MRQLMPEITRLAKAKLGASKATIRILHSAHCITLKGASLRKTKAAPKASDNADA